MRRTFISVMILFALSFTVLMPAPVGAQVEPVALPVTFFVDVPRGSFFEEPVDWLVANGITTGTTPLTFSPNGLVTRNQMATFLWRRAGKPAVTNICGYTDVPASSYFSMPACWMKSTGIMPGVTSTSFVPNGVVTRGDMALFLWRSAGQPNTVTAHHFSDIVSGSQLDAPVRWLRSTGVTVGLGSAYMYGSGFNVTRGQMAAFLWRSNFAGEATTILSSLTVAVERDRTGYNRNVVFGSWKDLDRNSCNTRCEVLARDKRFDLAGLSSGGWFSVFDGLTTSNAGSFDIDHMIPLAEAWDSGAAIWSIDRWTHFGNDLDDSRSLLAVSATSNRSKGDRDPAEWMPPSTSFKCQYAAEWVTLKSRWSLSIDSAERTFLKAFLSSCGSQKLVVIPAPPS